MSVATFQPILEPGMFSTPKNSRPSSSLSSTNTSTTDSSESESQIFAKMPQRNCEKVVNKHATHKKENSYHVRDTSNSPPSAEEKLAENKRFLLRRSSSAMRVRELRDVLTKMTEDISGENGGREKEVPVTGSQKARLLVASQQCLVSRLQDLRHEMESMDNEVTRVRNDIVNSRRYFSAMMGISCGPEWSTAKQTDSAYTSPTSFISRSTDISPYSSDNDYPGYTSTSSSHRMSSNSKANNAAFQQLQHFKDQQQQQQHPRTRGYGGGQLSRSDSCSSFTSWRSETEMASLFPEERGSSVSPQITPRTVRRRNSPE